MSLSLEDLNRRIVACERCPRLTSWCRSVADEKRRAFRHDTYWGRPVPNFGDMQPRGLIVGLAPAAHGANRTGRMFTGDRSGDWLYRALHKAGLANQALAEGPDDGLRLLGVLVTAVCHCAPPDNKPTTTEVETCRPFLLETLASTRPTAILCLGGLAWNQTLRAVGAPLAKFAHGAEATHNGTTIFASYHPSQQNTFTGRLTEEMLQTVVDAFARLVRRV